MKEITKNIRAALHKMKYDKLSNEEMGKLLGFSKKHIGKLLDGTVTSFEENSWERIYPILKRYISNECENICEGMGDADKLMVKRYKELDALTKERINDDVRKEFEDAQKKIPRRK